MATNDYARDSEDVGEDRPLLDGGETGGDGSRRQPWHRRPLSALRDALRPLSEPEKLSSTERVLLGAAVILLLLASIFVGLFAGAQARLNHGNGRSDQPGEPQDDGSTCGSRDCVLAAASILDSVDESVRPCDDFYQFAAGGWLKDINHRIPDDAGAFGTGQLVASKNRQLVLEILKEAPTEVEAMTLASSDETERIDRLNLAKLKTYYDSCMDTDLQDRAGSEPLLKLLKEMRQAFSRSDDSFEGDAVSLNSPPSFIIQDASSGPLPRPPGAPTPLPPNKAPGRAPRPHPPSRDPSPPAPRRGRQKVMTQLVSWAHSRGLWALWEISVDGNPVKDPTEGTIYLSPGGLGLPDKEYYSDDAEIKFYRRAVEEALLIIADDAKDNEDSSESQGRKEHKLQKVKALAREVVELEQALASFTPDGDALADPIGTYNPKAVNDLDHLFDGISWPDYLSSLTVRVPKKVIVAAPDFFKRLNELLSRTHDEVVEAYLSWTIVRTFGSDLGPKASLRGPAEAVRRRALGVDLDVKENRERTCLSALDGSLGFMTGRFFIQRAFPLPARRKVEHIISTIVAAFKARLPELEWLDEKTRAAAQVKADKIRVKVGWPDSPNTTDASAIARYYDAYHVEKGDHFGNQLRSTVVSVRRSLAQAGRKLDPLRWDMVPDEVNAYYNPGGAEIVFPAGILQAPYFDLAWPDYLQWGAFGAVSGHELSHAFDPTGRLYDEDGYLRDWWSEDTAREFTKRQNCLEHQYGNLTLDDGTGKQLPLNPKLTIGEDVADAGGIAQSFRAWQTRLASAGQDNLLLPGLGKYTREQLFFVAYGISWARSVRPAEALRRIRTDPHSPNPYRVNAVLTNFEPFNKAFGCKAGDAMFTPAEERCRIW
ncbi:unnamed protein product [Parajaminaea phylloscopi]